MCVLLCTETSCRRRAWGHPCCWGLAGVGPAQGPWTELSTELSGLPQTEFFAAPDGSMQTREVHRVVTLRGIPAKYAIDPVQCVTNGGFFPPVATTVLPDGSQLLTMVMCTVDRINCTFCEVNANPHCAPANQAQCDVCFKKALSTAAFRSTDGGWAWQFQGMAQLAADYVPTDPDGRGNLSQSTQGTTEEQVRADIIVGHARIKYVGEYQSCMVENRI